MQILKNFNDKYYLNIKVYIYIMIISIIKFKTKIFIRNWIKLNIIIYEGITVLVADKV